MSVGVEVTGPSGDVEFFPATQEGAVGHYVADVVFGESGVHTWAIRQGWFADHELGTIDTSTTTSSAAGGRRRHLVDTQFLRFGMPTLAFALAAYAAIRRDPIPPPAGHGRCVTKQGVASALGALLAVSARARGALLALSARGSDGATCGRNRYAPRRRSTDTRLFHAKGCATCHTGPTSTASMGEFPSLADASSWAGCVEPGLSAEEYLEESIREPWAFISPEFHESSGPTTAMPELGLSDAERDAVVAFLLSG